MLEDSVFFIGTISQSVLPWCNFPKSPWLDPWHLLLKWFKNEKLSTYERRWLNLNRTFPGGPAPAKQLPLRWMGMVMTSSVFPFVKRILMFLLVEFLIGFFRISTEYFHNSFAVCSLIKVQESCRVCQVPRFNCSKSWKLLDSDVRNEFTSWVHCQVCRVVTLNV